MKSGPTTHRLRLHLKFTIVAVVVLSLLCGFVLGRYGGRLRNAVKEALRQETADQEVGCNRDAVVLAHAFTEPLLSFQLLPPATTIEDVSKQVNGYYYPVADFFSAYDELQLKTSDFQGDIFKVAYRASGRDYVSYAYYRPDSSSDPTTSCAILVIPGSGPNQSTPIFNMDHRNYHGDVLAAFDDRCDSYVFVKPNEDFLAIHNGKKKLNENYILRYLINKGGSYSAHYLVNSMAMTKSLQHNYRTVIVMGLSQGGEAALINSLQSKPTAAIVASGFSLLTESIDYAGFNQILLPYFRCVYTNKHIYDIIDTGRTRYLFTYGREEDTIYRVEAIEKLVCRYFGQLPNVECRIHSAGHVFDQKSIRLFMLGLTQE